MYEYFPPRLVLSGLEGAVGQKSQAGACACRVGHGSRADNAAIGGSQPRGPQTCHHASPKP